MVTFVINENYIIEYKILSESESKKLSYHLDIFRITSGALEIHSVLI